MLQFFLFMSQTRSFWGLNGCIILWFWRHFRTKYWYICFNIPFESLQTDFSNKSYAKILKMHTFFLLFRSSILKLSYLCNFGSPRFEILSCGIPLSILSNPISHTEIGLDKIKLCPISHDDLVMHLFSTVNLYRMPHVTILTSSPKNDTRKTKFQ